MEAALAALRSELQDSVATLRSQSDKAYRDLGFRCAMTRTGGPTGNEDAAGITFKTKQNKVKRRYK